MQVRTEVAASYQLSRSITEQDEIIAAAIRILRERLHKPGAVMDCPESVRNFLSLTMAERETEAFGAIFLNTAHAVIAFEILFTGTIDKSAVYPREVAKAALKHNASAVIYVHNHPSGNVSPSEDDRRLTEALKQAMDLIGVRSLDHFIVGGSADLRITSMAELGQF